MGAPLTAALATFILQRFFDQGARSRGARYANEGRVEILSSHPGELVARCRGTRDEPYRLNVRWTGSTTALGVTDTCSCPLGGGCKHVVAALLTAGRQQRHVAPARWEQILSSLPHDRDDNDDAAGFALEFGLRQPSELTIRPLRRGARGWVKSGANWSDIVYGHRLADTIPAQRAVLRSMAISADLGYYTSAAPGLSQFGSDLWVLLRRAADSGIAFVGLDVRLADPAETRVEMSATPAGGIELRVVADVAGTTLRLDDPDAALVGIQPVSGLWSRHEGHVVLAPLSEPLHDAVALLARSGPVTVEAPDVDRFLDDYALALSRHVTVVSPDDSVSIDVPAFEGLVATLNRTTVDRGEVRWTARYRVGTRTRSYPVDSPAGVHRDRIAEAVAVSRLPRRTSGWLAGEALVEFVQSIPTLADDGVAVDIVDDHPPLIAATGAPHLTFTVDDAREVDGADASTDWFDLGVEVTIDDETVPFPDLIAALHRADTTLVLPSGTWLRLDRAEFDALRSLIDEANSLHDPPADGVARINRFTTSWFDELARLGVVERQSTRWQAALQSMRELAAPATVGVPDMLDATLRPYQQEGLDWLAFLHTHRLGGILADDMGLGKTVQAIGVMCHVHEERRRFLIVAPTSVVTNWCHELERFAPALRVAAINETVARREIPLADVVGACDVVVTSYALLRLEVDDYLAFDWEMVFFDEAQFLKNHRTKTYSAARRLDARIKVALTGTPLENSLMDLWSLLALVAPGLYPDPKRFATTFAKPIERGDRPEALDILRRRVAPLMRRRTKDAVLRELPPKTEQTVEIELSPRHARAYATQLQRERQKVLGLVEDVNKNRFEILRSLTVLRQLALDPSLIDADSTIGSAKLDQLSDDLVQVVAEGHRALVFSQFTRFLAKVRSRLDDLGIEHTYLDGRTRRREEVIEHFTSGEVPVFVISLKAGGFGLNLTQADYCFVLDPWWNPAAETQAIDRAHRIGQTNPVMVYRYVSVGTIEEKVMAMKDRKADLFANVMGGDQLSGALTDSDIRSLLDLS